MISSTEIANSKVSRKRVFPSEEEDEQEEADGFPQSTYQLEDGPVPSADLFNASCNTVMTFAVHQGTSRLIWILSSKQLLGYGRQTSRHYPVDDFGLVLKELTRRQKAYKRTLPEDVALLDDITV